MSLPIALFAGLKPSQKESLRRVLSGHADPRFESGYAELSARISQEVPVLLLIGDNLAGKSPTELAMEIRAMHEQVRVCLLVSPDHSLFTADKVPEEITEIWCETSDLDLSRRVLRYITDFSELRSLKKNSADTMRVAMTAMSSMGELGVVLRFLSDCFHKNDYSSVAGSVVESLGSYSLTGCCQLRGQGFMVTEVSEGESKESCDAVISKLSDVGRILEFKGRMIINYPNVSILMTNVPEDAEIRGRIRDNVAMLAEGAQARVTSLILESDNSRKRDGIQFALTEISEMATNFAKAQEEAFETASQAINTTLTDFSHTFLSLGLSDSEEGKLLDMVASLRTRIDVFHAVSASANSKIDAVTKSLREIEG